MIELGELFPGVMGKVINVKQLYPDVSMIRSYGAGYKIKWLDSNIPHPTIGKDHSQKPARWRINGHEHRPTTLEIQNIMSFYSEFIFAGNNNQNWNCIGNSVPPLFMQAIASQIRYKLWGGDKLQPMKKKIDYPAHLEAMWQKHLEPRDSNAPTVISTFAGCGGSSLGYSMAGYRELLAVEWNDNAVETFKLNFPDVPIYHGDITKLSVEECMNLAGLSGPGELDLLDGSPPCQGFSTAGKRNFNDSRNQLFREYTRLLRGLKPKVFVMENVSGLVKGKMKLIFAEMLKELKDSGYRVSARMLNAKYFHVPQSRERIIFIGVREDLGVKPGHPGAEGKSISVKNAIKNVQDFLPHKPDYNTKLGQCCRQLKQGENGEVLFGKNWGFQLIRLVDFLPAPTISKGGGATGFIHPTRDTKVSMGELKRLASFPDRYKFCGKRDKVQDRIGNSVPPLMIEAIARYIKENILSKVERWSDHTGKQQELLT